VAFFLTGQSPFGAGFLQVWRISRMCVIRSREGRVGTKTEFLQEKQKELRNARRRRKVRSQRRRRQP
jgi:hypothetical protein